MCGVDNTNVVTPPGVSVSMCQANTESVPGRLRTVVTAEGDNNKRIGGLCQVIRRPVARDGTPPGIIHNKYTRVSLQGPSGSPWDSLTRIRGALVPWFSLTRLPTSRWNLIFTRHKRNCIQSSELRSCPTKDRPLLTYQSVRPPTHSRDSQYTTVLQNMHDTTMHSGSKSQYILTIKSLNSLARKNDTREGPEIIVVRLRSEKLGQ